MLDKRLWPNVIYAVFLFVVCVTVWQITSDPEHLPPMAVYNVYSSNSSYSYPLNTLPPGDYHQLIDLSNFTFTILNLPCNDSSNPLLLTLVHSAPKHFEMRKLIRETWGRNTAQVKVLFATGLVKNSTLKAEIEQENEEFGDLIQGSFIDAYRNMTYKHVMVFKYAIYHCPQAKYILKTDDDVFVNMPRMMNFLKELSPFGGSNMLFCNVKKGKFVIRTWRSKWRVSFKEYPAKRYPPYCPGWVLFYSPDIVFELYREAQRADYFWIDDVHITGTLADKIHLTHVNIEKYVLTRTDMHHAFEHPATFNQSFLFGAPNVKDQEIKDLWEYVKNQDIRGALLMT